MITVDGSALFAILNSEHDAADYHDTALNSPEVLFSAASLAELRIVTLWRLGHDGLERLDHLIEALSITIVDFDAEQAMLTTICAERFGRGSGSPAKLNLGDCFSYALAKSRGLPLHFKGDDFVHTDLVPALDRRPASG